MSETFALMRPFLAVAEAGSISRGAVKLAMSQPAVTKAIHRLERELGVSLFERRARGVVPTRFGEALLRHAKLIEAEWSFARAEIEAVREGHAGSLRVAGGPYFGVALLPGAIARLHREYPQLRVDLQIGVNTLTLPKLLAGDLDLVVGRQAEAAELPAYILREPIAEIQIEVIAGPDHPLTGKRRVGTALADYPWVVYQEDHETIAKMMGVVGRLSGRPPRIVVEATSLIAVAQLLRAGPYLSILAQGLLRTPFGQGLSAIDIGEPVARFAAGAMVPRTLANVAPVQRLIALLHEGARARR